MFDLITGKTPHMPGGGGVPVLVSSALHGGLLGLIVIVPLLFVTHVLPDVPTMMAFVAPAPLPPPPPPPPPRASADKSVKPTVSDSPNAAPVEAPSRIEPEAVATAGRVDEGVPGGIEGGLPGGVLGGIVGGLPDAPPPPAPPPATPGPVRIGGAIQQPRLVRRVEPAYPEIALQAHVAGTVILEAIVGETGAVQSVRVLRSIPLLDRAAIAAVEQWRYTPVLLGGRPVPFILTVVLTFTIPQGARY